MRRILSAVVLAVAAASYAASAAAQQPEPPRPELSRNADTRDWEAYFDEGTRLFETAPTRAAAAFYWAARLEPSRAEPLFAQWAAFYAQDWGNWLAYVEEQEHILRRPTLVANEALRERAFYRNPFVHRAFEAALWSRLGRRLRWDGATRAFMNYGQADFRQAAEGFGRTVRANPEQNAHFRYWRALAFVGGQQLDSAVVEVTELLATLRAQDQATISRYYQSKALLEYALGRLHEAAGHPDQAREAYGRALVEDLTMYPARAALARMALRQRNAAEAAEHMAQVVEIAPDDAVMHYEHGNALVAAGRTDDAIAAFQAASRLEPHWADPYVRLGMALERSGQRDQAVSALRAYLERAPRRHAEGIETATRYLDLLGATP